MSAAACQPGNKQNGVYGLAMLKAWPAAVVNAPAVALLCWLVMSEMPRQRDEFSADLRMVGDRFAGEMKAARERDELRTERLVQAIEDLRRSIGK